MDGAFLVSLTGSEVVTFAVNSALKDHRSRVALLILQLLRSQNDPRQSDTVGRLRGLSGSLRCLWLLLRLLGVGGRPSRLGQLQCALDSRRSPGCSRAQSA